MSSDRRVRLRPKDGARSLYYSGGFSGVSNTTNFRQSMLDRALGNIPDLPWLSNSPMADSASNALDAAGISDAINGSDAAGIGGAINATDTAGISKALATQYGVSQSDVSVTYTDNQILNFSDNQFLGIGQFVGSLFGGKTSKTLGGGSSSPSILSPLAQTDGLIFPYTPTVDFGQQVDYNSYDPVHSNQELHAYQRTKAPTISVTGEFTAQNQYEASYSLAAFHFCRAVSKMAFGQSANPGTPPPILLLSAYGEYMLSDVPVILTGFSVSLPKDVDYVQVPNSTSYVPATFTLNISLIVQNTPSSLRTFSLEQFRSGNALKKGWT